MSAQHTYSKIFTKCLLGAQHRSGCWDIVHAGTHTHAYTHTGMYTCTYLSSQASDISLAASLHIESRSGHGFWGQTDLYSNPVSTLR